MSGRQEFREENLSLMIDHELTRKSKTCFPVLEGWETSKAKAVRFLQLTDNDSSQGCASSTERFDYAHSASLIRPTEHRKGGYQCSVCSQHFSQSGTLNRHMRIHEGGPTFECAVCWKIFSRNDSLMRHMRFAHK